ncbi:unnamed protein product [Peniophora sp. CBMAI 1063]|nr:unnamed protein product [Peniophora sp. CBMAI 1063]
MVVGGVTVWQTRRDPGRISVLGPWVTVHGSEKSSLTKLYTVLSSPATFTPAATSRWMQVFEGSLPKWV